MRLFIVWLSCLFSGGFCLRETCTRHRLTYQDGLIFTSEKDDGRFYTCTCRYSNCAQIVCRINRGSTSPSRETEDENNVPYVPFPSVSTDNEDICYDRSGSTVERYRRGQYFVKTGSSQPLIICTCPMSGPPILSCKQPKRGCSLPQAPAIDWISFIRKNRGVSLLPENCIDPWNEQFYVNGQRYTRTRLMNDNDTLTGDYSCLCQSGDMRCRARDIPCCDLATGKFVRINEKFLALVRGEYQACVCQRQQRRFAYCQTIDRPSSLEDRPTINTPSTKTCVDGDAVYRVGQKLSKTSRDGYYTRTCTCTADGFVCDEWKAQDRNPTNNQPSETTPIRQICVEGDAVYTVGQEWSTSSKDGFYARRCSCEADGQITCGEWETQRNPTYNQPTASTPTTRSCFEGDMAYTVGQRWDETSSDGYYIKRCFCTTSGRITCGEWQRRGDRIPTNNQPSAATPITQVCVEGDAVYTNGQEWSTSSEDGFYSRRCSCAADGQITCGEWETQRNPRYNQPTASTPTTRSCVEGDMAYTVGQRWDETSSDGYYIKRCFCTTSGRIRCDKWRRKLRQ